jgi:YfiH family protein
MQKISLNRISIYRFDIFNEHHNIKHFITTRNPNEKMEFNICLWAVDEIFTVIENRKILASELGIPLSSFVFQQQMHTSKVSTVSISDGGRGFDDYETALEDNDGMVTNEKGICMVIIGGDCVPLLFYDPVKQVIGATHSGWRGTAKRIAEHTINNMQEKYNCNPSDILVGIGPSISAENYEVDGVVLESFSKTFKNTKEFFKPNTRNGKYYLDLWKANKIQLIEAGVLPKNIEISGICTFKNNNEFFSARRGDSGRFGCGIMLV